MTGWRIGYAGGPAALIRAMAVVHSQSTSCPSSVSQAAAIAALNGPLEIVQERCQSFQARRDLVVTALNGIEGISCRIPQGAFYTFAGYAGLIGTTTEDGQRINSDTDFAEYLLRAAGVAVVPRSAFGLVPYFRISYATSVFELEEPCGRIARGRPVSAQHQMLILPPKSSRQLPGAGPCARLPDLRGQRCQAASWWRPSSGSHLNSSFGSSGERWSGGLPRHRAATPPCSFTHARKQLVRPGSSDCNGYH